MKVLKLFWACFASIGGVLATYIALEEVNLLWAFWVLVPISILTTAVIWYAANGVEVIQKIRNYPKLLARVQAAESDLDDAVKREKTLISAAQKARDEGVLEGQRQVIGSFLSARTEIPVIIATVEFGGQVSFLCSRNQESPPEGARFVVESANSGAVRGVVEARHSDAGETYLVCVDPSSPPFWKRLAETIDLDDAVPDGIRLSTYSHVAPEEVSDRPVASMELELKPEVK